MPSDSGRDVQQQHVLYVARQDAGLDRGANGHDLVGVDALVRFLATEHLLDRLENGRHTRLTADEDHLVDVGRLEAGVLQCGFNRAARPLDQVSY